GAQRRGEHRPNLATRHVNEPDGVNLSEEDPCPTMKEHRFIPRLGEATETVVHKRPQDDPPRGGRSILLFHAPGEKLAILGPGHTFERKTVFGRWEHARLRMGRKEIQES